MSIFTQTNKDATVAYSDQIASGPRLGFLGAFEASYDAQVRAASAFGLEAAMREEEQDNRRRIKAAGGEAPASLNDSEDSEYIPRMMGGSGFTAGLNSGKYMDYARAAADQDQNRTSAVLGDREDKLKALQERYPNAGIRTYSEIFENVRKRAQDAERVADQSAKTIPGYIGGFLGDAAAGMDPRVNPLNFLTLPAGAVGKTVLGRIGSQAGAQGAIETVNQVTGVQENRRILGLQSGFANAAGNIAGAAIGGAALQGLGEGVAAVGRKWFRNAPHDPAPPMPEPRAVTTEASPLRTIEVPPETAARIKDVVGELLTGRADPMAKSRVGAARATADLDHAAVLMDRWDAPAPWEMPPTTATRPFSQLDPNAGFKLDVSSESLTVDARARLIDPETFNIYDKLANDISAIRARIADVDTIREQSRLAAAADTTQQQIDTLQAQLAKMKEGSARAQRVQQQIADLEAARPAAPAVSPDAARAEADLRAELMRADEQMRDLAPVVSRAYARARNEWAADEALRGQVDEMIARGGAELPPPKDIGEAPDALFRPYTIEQKVPQLTRTDVPRGPGDTPADVVAKVLDKDREAMETALAAHRADVIRALKDENANLTIDGIEGNVKLSDVIELDTPDGVKSMTLREVFEDLNEELTMLKAITSCRLSNNS